MLNLEGMDYSPPFELFKLLVLGKQNHFIAENVQEYGSLSLKKRKKDSVK